MGIYGVLINKTMNDFSIYHLLILCNIEEFIKQIVNPNKTNFDLIILLIFFFIEFLMYLIFLEIIELNFCGLSQNIRKNIKKRALNDSKLEDDNDNRDSFIDNNNDDINNETSNNSYSNNEGNNDDNENSIEKNELVNIDQ